MPRVIGVQRAAGVLLTAPIIDVIIDIVVIDSPSTMEAGNVGVPMEEVVIEAVIREVRVTTTQLCMKNWMHVCDILVC